MIESELQILDNILWAERCIKKYPTLHTNIINFNSNLDIPFKVKVYNYYHDIKSIPKCKICDNQVKFYNGSYAIYCGNKCANNDPDFKLIREKSMLDRHGVKSFIGTKKSRDKIKRTNLEKYGFEVASKSDLVKGKLSESKKNIPTEDKLEINNKRKQTIIEKYGVDNVAKSDLIKSKTIESNLKKWGHKFPIINKDVLEKRKNNYIEKTGKTHHFQFDEIVKKMQSSRKKTMSDKYLSKLNDLNLDVKSYNSDGTVNIFCNKCNAEYNIVIYVLYQRIQTNRTICLNCNPLYNKTSSYQSEILNFLEEKNIKPLKNDREILGGKEIDILIPDKNIAIEFNGMYWHSEAYKDKFYHLNKTLLCKEKDIQLIHIWEDDWRYKNEIIKSIILNKLGLIENKIHARKCDICLVNPTDSMKFLNNNHIQGASSSTLKIGLLYNNELVSLMTFGWRYTNGKKEYELIRFCNKIGNNVIGAASKLFAYFLKNYDIEQIVSYSDISLFDGNIYEKLRFKKVSTSRPNYFWIVDGVRKHRFNYNKKKLINQGFDPKKSEVEIMHERGYFRAWGCGQDKWIYQKITSNEKV